MRHQAHARRIVQRRRLQQRLRALQQRGQVVVLQRLQHMHGGARQQRRVDLEGRVLGGRADEGEQPRLDMRQEGVLLRLVEAVHLVDEDDGRAAGAARGLGALDRLADVLDTGEHGRQHDEIGIHRSGHQPCQRGLAHARRAPQDHRMQVRRFEGHAQRATGAEQVRLAGHFVERARTHAFGQRHAAVLRPRRGARPCGLGLEQRLLRVHALRPTAR